MPPSRDLRCPPARDPPVYVLGGYCQVWSLSLFVVLYTQCTIFGFSPRRGSSVSGCSSINCTFLFVCCHFFFIIFERKINWSKCTRMFSLRRTRAGVSACLCTTKRNTRPRIPRPLFFLLFFYSSLLSSFVFFFSPPPPALSEQTPPPTRTSRHRRSTPPT